MIVNPYSEIISLHDMQIVDFTIENNNALIKLNEALLFSPEADYTLDNPLIIVNDLINLEENNDYPIRIKLLNDTNVKSIGLLEFKNYNFTILEETYGFGLVHFLGVATRDGTAYDCTIDIHYYGELELKWDSKVLVEV